MRPFGIELADEGIEALLLLQAVGARRPGCFLLESEVHALVASVLLRMAGLDAFAMAMPSLSAKIVPPNAARQVPSEHRLI